MSAESITTETHDVTNPSRPFRLRLLHSPRPILSPLGFGLVITLMVAVGLAIVMVVTTSVSAQSRELTALRREAREVSYTVAALTTELQTVSSTASLALRATDLGMVPNPYPAFIELSDGTILGDPTPVEGDETSYLGRIKLPPAMEPVIQVLPAAEPVTETSLPAQDANQPGSADQAGAATEDAEEGAPSTDVDAATDGDAAPNEAATDGDAATESEAVNDHGADLADEVSEESLVEGATDGGEGQ